MERVRTGVATSSRHNDGLWPNQPACINAQSAKSKQEAEIFINMYDILPIVKSSELHISMTNSEIHNSAEVHFSNVAYFMGGTK